MSAGFTNDEEYDKIGFSEEDSLSVPFTNANWTQYQEFVYSYPHGMAEQPLADGIFSINGVDYFSSGENNYFQAVSGTGGAGYFYVVGFVDADTTNIYVVIGSNYTTNRDIQFKITGEYKQ